MGSGGDLALKVILQAKDMASGVVKGFGSTLIDLAGAGGPFLKVAFAIGAAAIGIGVVATRMAGDFQQAMLSLVAHAGLAKSQFDNVSQAVLNMAGEVGRSPTELADALYPILSAFSGITNQSAKSTLALDTLRMSFQAVAGTTVNGTSVANAAVGTFNALGLATNNAATNAKRMSNLFDVMDLTVQQGNMTWDAYKNVISKLAISIQGTGVSFNEASAALSTLTNAGMSAQKAQTYLSNMFVSMAIKTDALAAHAKKLKITFDEQKYSSMDLAHKMEYLNQITDGNKQKLLALLGGNATALKSFNALSTGLGNYKTNLEGLKHSQGALKTSFETASQGLNFALSKAKAAVDALFIRIGTALIPVVTKLVNAVAPAINGFINFATAVSKNQVAMAFIQAALITFAGVILAIVIPAFVAWTIGAWNVAAANIAAFWPIYLVVAIIVVVVAAVILAIQHWGAIAAWLQGVWKGVVFFFQVLWQMLLVGLKAVGQFFVNIWNGIVAGVRAAWAWIVGAVQAGLAFLVAVFMAPFRAIGALFNWLYNHNYYFKALVDKIRQIIQAGLAWLKNAWQAAINWLVGLWHNVSTWATNAWNAVKTAIINAVVAILVWQIEQWTKASKWLSDKWMSFKDLMGNAWKAVSSFLASVWSTYVSKPLQLLWNSMMNFLNGWPKQMVQFGINLIQGLINGITSMIGKVKDTAGNVMKAIAGFLGFHSPAKEGEGRFIIQYGANMLKGFSAGILSAVPALKAQVAMAIHGGMQPLSPPALSTIPYGRPPSGNSYSSFAGGNTHNGDIVIHAPAGMNIKQLADEIERRQNSKFRRSGIMGNTAWGARNS